MDKRLFVVQVVVCMENQWFAWGTDNPPIRSEKRYFINQKLIAASDEDSAYQIAKSWIDHSVFSDSNHDGPGDLTIYSGLGIHEIEEIERLDEFDEKTHDSFGVELPGFDLEAIDESGIPIIPQREDLEIFRVRSIFKKTAKEQSQNESDTGNG